MRFYKRERRDPMIEDMLRGKVCTACSKPLTEGPVIYNGYPMVVALHAPCAADWSAPLFGSVDEFRRYEAQQSHRGHWAENKILGGLAEEVCRQHFEAIGYILQAFGIEHTAGTFISTRDGLGRTGTIPGSFGEILRDLPDFLVSRLCPNTHLTRASKVANRPQAAFVQVKYYTKFDRRKDFERLKNRYANLIKLLPENFLFYVLAKTATSGADVLDSHVFIADPTTNEVRTCGVDPFIDMPSFITAGASTSFNDAYAHSVVPALERLWGAVRKYDPLPSVFLGAERGEKSLYLLGAGRDNGSWVNVVDSCLSITDSREAFVVESLFDMFESEVHSMGFDSAIATVCEAIAQARREPNGMYAGSFDLLLRILKCVEEAQTSPYNEFAVERARY